MIAWVANPIAPEPVAVSTDAASGVSTDTSAALGEDPAEGGVAD